MKYAVILNSINEIKDIDYTDTFLMPINRFSMNYPNTFSLEEIEKISKKYHVFIILNKNIHESELDDLRELLEKIDKLNIMGVVFYDISLINLKEELSLSFDLVWSQEHLVTNYQTINFYLENNCKYAYLSSELTLSEIKEIRKNTSSKLLMNVYGYVPMFTSFRPLISDYYNYFSLEKNNKNKYLFKEEKKYQIFENKNGTFVYSNYILNNLNIDLKDIDYLVINTYGIKDIKNILNDKNYNNGFLFNETIYKVKK